MGMVTESRNLISNLQHILIPNLHIKCTMKDNLDLDM